MGAGGIEVCGTLNPNSSAKVDYHFAYDEGSDCASGQKTTGGSVEGEGVAVSEQLTGLEPDTVYAYCLVASNAFGETYGEALAFKTPSTAAPEAPITEACAEPDLGGGAWLLCGTLNPGLPPQSPVSYYFAYDTDGGCAGGERTALGPAFASQSVAVSEQVSGLAPGTAYSYCLVAVNGHGETYGGALSFQTPAPPRGGEDPPPSPAPPAVPLLQTNPVLAPHSGSRLQAARRRFLKWTKACARKPTRRQRVRCRKRARASYARARESIG